MSLTSVNQTEGTCVWIYWRQQKVNTNTTVSNQLKLGYISMLGALAQLYEDQQVFTARYTNHGPVRTSLFDIFRLSTQNKNEATFIQAKKIKLTLIELTLKDKPFKYWNTLLKHVFLTYFLQISHISIMLIIPAHCSEVSFRLDRHLIWIQQRLHTLNISRMCFTRCNYFYY